MAESPRQKPKDPPPARRETRYLDLSRSQHFDTTRPAPAPARPSPAAREAAGRPAAPADGRTREPEPSGPLLTRRQFEAEHQRLLRQFGESGENPGSFSCQGCQNCASCMFCVDCAGSYRCTHSTRCRDSSHLTHCEDCQNCHGCAYCARCENCSGSSYLVLCRSCSDCTYCFGCVGLSKKDFHILNVKYTKNEYFRLVRALQAEMKLSRPG
jgi:hypothetical protein